jgi:hypothetical protein
MMSEAPQLELERLRNQQATARADEVFGGMSRIEMAAYDLRRDRILELEHDLSEPGASELAEGDRPGRDSSSRNR